VKIKTDPVVMADCDKRTDYKIRHRFLINGGEYQVIIGNKIVRRFDLEKQAKDWIEHAASSLAGAGQTRF
jgi:hypothetical protein